ncbi:MAG TPA: AAA family ATPase [Planctomycetota bacterium]|nr:AAA family ATPase [Planctomycetota bacterium]
MQNDDITWEDITRHIIQNLPLIPPKQAYQLLQEQGYYGQEIARKSLCLAAYRHIKRLKNIYVHNIPRNKLPSKNNILLLGPTGCGKTFLVEQLFRQILRLPTIIVDMTTYTETGYIGDNVRSIFTRLLQQTDSNPNLASIGIICLDEFDKISSASSNARFGGAGTTKDVSGYGVQRELLKLLEEAMIEVDTSPDNPMYSEKIPFFTGDLMFIACGAFSYIKTALWSQTPKIGYKNPYNQTDRPDEIAYTIQQEELNNINTFQTYGFIPELIGRFHRIIPLQPLDKDTLKEILVNNILKQFQHEFILEDIKLHVEENVLDYIVDKSLEQQTGARSLANTLTYHIENIAFEHFHTEPGKATLTLKDNKIHTTFQ